MKETTKSFLSELLLFSVAVFYIVVCPFTKVEESFNVQASHDLLYHGLDIEKYDHLEFPGVVPRTFIGSIVTSLMSFPFVKILSFFQQPKVYSLIVVRMALALLNCLAIHHLRKALVKKFGTTAGYAFILICCTQFHLLFYMGRPLPNTFAMALITFAFGYYLDERYTPFICLLTFCCVVVRCDTLVLFAPFLLSLLLTGRVSFLRMAILGITSGLLSLFLSFLVDSYFWRRPMAPELVVLFYNTVLNKSSNWGTQPYHWYLTSVLPRLFYNCLFFLPFALSPGLASLLAHPRDQLQRLWQASRGSEEGGWRQFRRAVTGMLKQDAITTSVLGPVLGFVMLYSLLPHKELRFLLPMVPVVNACAAVGCARLWARRPGGKRIGVAAVLIYVMGGCIIAAGFLAPSVRNYPGGHAMMRMNEVIAHDIAAGEVMGVPKLHVDVYSAQTGVSRFLEAPGVIVDKTEELTDFSGFDYLLTHNATEAGDGFRVVGEEQCFAGIDWKRGRMRMDTCVYLMKREGSERNAS
ncbi:hypothetical protein WA538_000460 [Blastocystis sp. DL]